MAAKPRTNFACTAPGCTDPAKARQLCGHHYKVARGQVRSRTARNSESLDQRLERNTERDPNSGCWLWSGAQSHGYGWMAFKGEKFSLHRLAWSRANGPIPDGMVICHRCDTPSCINPDHLFVGTHSDNTRDMVAKGRARPFGRSDFNPRCLGGLGKGGNALAAWSLRQIEGL